MALPRAQADRSRATLAGWDSSHVAPSTSLRTLRLKCTDSVDLEQPRSDCASIQRYTMEYLSSVAPCAEVLHLDAMELEAKAWQVLPAFARLVELRIHAPLDLPLSRLCILAQWRCWRVIHIEPSLQSKTCGCRWRITRTSRCHPPLSWSSEVHTPMGMAAWRLVQDALPNADEHGRLSCEYWLVNQKSKHDAPWSWEMLSAGELRHSSAADQQR